MKTHESPTQPKYAQSATTTGHMVRSVAELRMTLEAKARGQRIAHFRRRRRLTQQAMAERLGVSYRAYQTWEAGTMPEWPNLEKLAAFFEIAPETLIGEPPALNDSGDQLDRIEAKLDQLLGTTEADLPPDNGP